MVTIVKFVYHSTELGFTFAIVKMTLTTKLTSGAEAKFSHTGLSYEDLSISPGDLFERIAPRLGNAS